MGKRDSGHEPAGWPDEDGYLDDPELDDAGFDETGLDDTGLDDTGLDEVGLYGAAFDGAGVGSDAFDGGRPGNTPRYSDAFDGGGFNRAGFDGAGFDDIGLGDPEALPYPLTYERGNAAAAPSDAAWPDAAPWPAAPDRVGQVPVNPRAAGRPGGALSAGRPPWQPDSPSAPDERDGASTAHAFDLADGLADGLGDGRACGLAGGLAGGLPNDEPWIAGRRGRRRWDRASGRPRWLIPVGVAVGAAVLGSGAVLLTSGHPGSASAVGQAMATRSAGPSARPSGSQPAAPSRSPSPSSAVGAPPLTLAAARQVLAAYTSGNNTANAARSDADLAMIETGGSYAIDAGSYAFERASGSKPFPPFAPVTATYYIPRSEPSDGTRWFVVRVANAFSAAPTKVTSNEYLLFTQSAAGARWRNAIEPNLLTGAAVPQIALGPDGLATAVSLSAGPLAAAPGQLATLTAESMDGVGGGVFVTTASPGLTDRATQKFWRGKLPGTRVHDAHAAATGAAAQTFALRTANGGALVFYTDSAELTFTPPAGSTLHLTVPGLYSPAQALSTARLAFLDQFAAYDPPPGTGPATVIASYSGVTGKT